MYVNAILLYTDYAAVFNGFVRRHLDRKGLALLD